MSLLDDNSDKLLLEGNRISLQVARRTSEVSSEVVAARKAGWGVETHSQKSIRTRRILAGGACTAD